MRNSTKVETITHYRYKTYLYPNGTCEVVDTLEGVMVGAYRCMKLMEQEWGKDETEIVPMSKGTAHIQYVI